MTPDISRAAVDGLLLIDKPAGWTSHDAVAYTRRVLGQRSVGHTGTLDPLATGLLVLCTGQATRMVEYMMAHDKDYAALIRLGRTTNTDDAMGVPGSARPVPQLSERDLDRALGEFRGTFEQRPPAFSAIKVQGRRAYDLSRQGMPPDLPLRMVTIHALGGRILEPDLIALHITCSAGTYVRSLARDLGDRLECGAHLVALRRERIGHFQIDEAITLRDLAALGRVGRIRDVIVPADEAVRDFPAAVLGRAHIERFGHGGVLAGLEVPAEITTRCIRVFGGDGAFAGVGTISATGDLRPRKVMRDASA